MHDSISPVNVPVGTFKTLTLFYYSIIIILCLFICKAERETGRDKQSLLWFEFADTFLWGC